MKFSLRIWTYTFGAYALLSLPILFFHPAVFIVAFVVGFLVSIPAWLMMLVFFVFIKFMFPNSGMYVVNILVGIAIGLVALIYVFFLHGREWDHLRVMITFPSIAIAAAVTGVLMNTKRIARYMTPRYSKY